MRRLVFAFALASGLLAAAPARADEDAKGPDPAHLKTAADEFDAGVAALKHKDYAAAATHFEAADAAVPGARALRQAIRAHVEAGHAAQAATLAAQALARYPDDAATAKLARETIEKYEPSLHKLKVSCASPCVPAVGGHAVPGAPARRWVLYLEAGSASVGASFQDAGEGDAPRPRTFEAKEGGESDLALSPVRKAAPAPPVSEPPPDEAKPDDSRSDDSKPDEPTQERKGISPAFFGVGVGVTAVLAATTIWSGVDTETNPGPDAVRMACQGKGTSCPLYQEGLSKQTRTNGLIGATAVSGAVTVVLAVFTRWHGGEKSAPPAEPTAIWVDHGAALGAAGVF